jgi:hypothetical protein
LTLSGGTLSSTGGGSGTVTSVAATQPASGLTITGSPITTSGTLVFALNNDLQGLENLATNGMAVRTATSTWATRTLTAGSGISITNGDGIAGNPTISATGGGGTVTNTTTLVDGRVTQSSGATSITDDAGMTYDRTNDRLVVGTGTGVATINAFPTATTGTVEGVRFVAGTAGNATNVISNTNNAGGVSHAIQEISTGGTSGGDPFLSLVVSGGNRVSFGVDNSDLDKFKISPGATTPGGTANKGLILTQDATTFVGINKDAPTTPLDVVGTVKADQFRGQSNTMNSGLVAFGNGAGTTPTLQLITGYCNGFVLSFRTGTAPTTNGAILTITYPTPFVSFSAPVFSARSVNSATEITKFYVSSTNQNAMNFTANGTLNANTDYSFYFSVNGF